MEDLLNKGPVKKVKEFIKKFDSKLEVLVLDTTARTAQDAANSLKCEVGAIVKSLLFRAENTFLICLIAGDKRCSLNKLKKTLEIKDIEMKVMFKNGKKASDFTINWDSFSIDFSKNRINKKTLSLLFDLATECDLYQAIEQQFCGVKINQTLDSEIFKKYWEKYVDHVVLVELQERWDTYNNPPENAGKGPCNYLWGEMNIWADGLCNPCDVDYKSELSVGNIQENSIKEIWTGEKYQNLRNLHKNGKRNTCHPCDRCSSW